ncbi:unnamed protein product, partial [Protopolystoma xenopodis]
YFLIALFLIPVNRAAALADQYRKKAVLFKTGNIVLVPLGDDFRFLSTKEWDIQVSNYRKLIQYYDDHPELRITLRFSTLSNYFDRLHELAGVDSDTIPTQLSNHQGSFKTFVGDMFTYADRDHDYWSGYFTSRPFYKRMSRTLESELRTAEILYSFARHRFSLWSLDSQSFLTQNDSISIKFVELFDKLYSLLTLARRNLGLFQHHDGITGTATSRVVQDYNIR